jgi:hypothetical protein
MAKDETTKDDVKAAELEKVLTKIKGDLFECQYFIDSNEKEAGTKKLFGDNTFTDIGVAIIYINAAIADLKRS